MRASLLGGLRRNRGGRANGGPGVGSGTSTGLRVRRSAGTSIATDRKETRSKAAGGAADPSTDERSATERIQEMRRALEEARAEAILNPTRENVTAYLRLQQETLQRAAAFSDAFRRTVWATPELDYTLRRPVGALAKQVWSDERRRPATPRSRGSASATG